MPADLKKPEDWLWYYIPPDTINSSQWPWKAWTSDQLFYIQSYEPWATNIDLGNAYLLYPLCPLGCIGNLFIILTILVGRHGEQKETADICMVTIAVLDLIFLILKIPYKFDVYVPNIQNMITNLPVFNNQIAGIMYTCSLLSDLIIFLLTCDRCVAIAYPLKYNKHKTGRNIAWISGMLLSVLTAMTRLNYCISGVACKKNYTGFGSSFATDGWCQFKNEMSYFTDVLMPFILAAIMIGLIFMILFNFWQRKQNMTKMTNDINQLNEARKQFKKVRSLMCVMLVMYLLNQCGYIYYEIAAHAYENIIKINFDSSFDDALQFALTYRGYRLSMLVSNLAEVSSRALTFYPYVLINKSFRRDFMRIFLKDV